MPASTNRADWNTLYATNPAAMQFNWSETITTSNALRFYRIKTGPPLP